MDYTKLQGWWSHRQGLDGRCEGRSAADVLQHTGWARSVGGAGPYLTLFSRGGIGRRAADEAAAHLEILELPSARGCTYVVPCEDFGLALRVGQGFFTEMRTAAKLGVKESEIGTLCSAIVRALAKGPLEPEGLREATGGAARHLGEAGKKKGLITTLPVAIGKLQADGIVRRIATNGRFDQQRYSYALWEPSPLLRLRISTEEAFTELARRFFAWIGPATLAEFQWFSGLGAKAARTAVEPLGLVPADGLDEFFLMPQDRDAFRDFKVPKQPHYSLVSSLDGISHLRRDVEKLLAPGDAKTSIIGANGLTDLSNHAIVDRGRLVGLWEYDTGSESLVWMPLIPRNQDLEKAVARTEEFVRSELGDARSFSLDSPKSRAPRIEALRKAARA